MLHNNNIFFLYIQIVDYVCVHYDTIFTVIIIIVVIIVAVAITITNATFNCVRNSTTRNKWKLNGGQISHLPLSKIRRWQIQNVYISYLNICIYRYITVLDIYTVKIHHEKSITKNNQAPFYTRSSWINYVYAKIY